MTHRRDEPVFFIGQKQKESTSTTIDGYRVDRRPNGDESDVAMPSIFGGILAGLGGIFGRPETVGAAAAAKDGADGQRHGLLLAIGGRKRGGGVRRRPALPIGGNVPKRSPTTPRSRSSFHAGRFVSDRRSIR